MFGQGPGRLRWNLRIHPWNRKIIFQATISRFYVNLPGCIYSIYIYFKKTIFLRPNLGVPKMWTQSSGCSRVSLVPQETLRSLTGWWFQIFLIFIPIPGGMIHPIWRAYFSKGLVQPPTSFVFAFYSSNQSVKICQNQLNAYCWFSLGNSRLVFFLSISPDFQSPSKGGFLGEEVDFLLRFVFFQTTPLSPQIDS